MNRTIVIVALTINFLTAGCAKMGNYVDPMLRAHSHLHSLYMKSVVTQQPTEAPKSTYATHTTYLNDGPIVLDRINEEAFIEYRDSLKDAVHLISILSNPQMANPYFVTQVHTQLSTSIIEIEQWPADALAIAWQTMGGEVESLSDLFESQRNRLVNDERYSADFRQALAQITLLTRN